MIEEDIKDIIDKCMNIIASKKVDLKDVAFKMGTTINNVYKYLSNPINDITLYITLYNILLSN